MITHTAVVAHPVTTMASLTGFFMSAPVLGIAATIYLVILTATKYLPPKVSGSAWYNRLLPIMPEILGVGATFTDAFKVPPELAPWVMHHIVVGLWMGLLSSKAYKIVDQTVRGNDEAIKPTTKPVAK